MILPRHKLAFVHIPKTGGTSVVRAFVEDDDFAEHEVDYPVWRVRMRDVLDDRGVVLPTSNLHAGPSATKRMIGDVVGDDPKDYRFFTIVRDPWSLLRSCHRYLVKRGRLLDSAAFEPLMHSAALNAMQRAADAVRTFDDVLRFESLQRDWATLVRKYGLDVSTTLPHVNATDRTRGPALEYPAGPNHRLLRALLRDYCNAFDYRRGPL